MLLRLVVLLLLLLVVVVALGVIFIVIGADGVAATIGPRGGAPAATEKVRLLMWSGGSWAGFLHGDTLTTPNYLGHAVDKTRWNNGTGCPVQCEVITDKSRLAGVDGVVFEAQPLTGYYDEYKRNPPQMPVKFPHQYWINHGYEQQSYFNVYEDPGYLDYIDINATYMLHSQVPLTFTCLWGGVGYNEDTRVPTPDIFLQPPPKKSKERNVVFMATNCASGGAAYRTEYVRELMQHMDIDSFGRCLHNRDMPANMRAPIYSDHGSSMRNKISVFQNYKFVLTFENNNITDYVTEKLINVLQAGSVPVYMGAPNVDPYWMPGEKSIIRTDQFSGPKELAEYLTYLNENDDAYMEWFAWKKKPLNPHFIKRFNDCGMYGAECRMCQYIAERRKRELADDKDARQDNNERRNKERINQGALILPKGAYVGLRTAAPKLDQDFTLKLWVKLDSLEGSKGDEGFVLMQLGDAVELSLVSGKQPDSQEVYVRLCVRGTPWQVGKSSSSSAEPKQECFLGSRGLVVNQWYHVTASWSFKPGPSGASGLNVNGVQDPITFTPTVQLGDVSGGPVSIGARIDGSRKLSGCMVDDVQVYSDAFSAKRSRTAIYDAPLPHSPGLAAAWLFNGDSLDDTKPGGSALEHMLAEGHGRKGNIESLATKPMVSSNACL